MAKSSKSPKTPRMTGAEVERELGVLHEWSETGEAIQRTYQFANFADAMKFVNKAAAAAEAMNHHPDILIRYSKVTMTLSTHDAGGITGKDFELAAQLDKLL